MRPSTIAGITLIVIGTFLFFRGGSFTSRRDVLNVGGLKVSAEEQRPIQPWVAGPWVAGLAVIAGVALIATGVRRKA